VYRRNGARGRKRKGQKQHFQLKEKKDAFPQQAKKGPGPHGICALPGGKEARRKEGKRIREVRKLHGGRRAQKNLDSVSIVVPLFVKKTSGEKKYRKTSFFSEDSVYTHLHTEDPHKTAVTIILSS